MKNQILSIITSFALLLSGNIFSQDIDPTLFNDLSLDQIEAAKDILDKEAAIEETTPLIKESTKEVADEGEAADESSEVGAIKKYGYDFFTTIPTSVMAVGDLPLPGDYRISLVDQFTVILSGSKQVIFDLNVQLDGTVLFPELGSISVVGETFNEVKAKLRNLVEQSYIGVNLDLSLKNLAARKITIVGAVKNPGTYLVNPFSTISSALAYSGGILEIGTLRNIKLLRSSGQVFNFDLYQLLIDGDRSQDINIESGDVILINPAQQFIELDGEINRPAIYEIKEGETFRELVKFGAGFTNIANKKNIDYKLLDIESSSIKLLNNKDINSTLANVLSVKVNRYNNKDSSNILVFGAVKEPGHYLLQQNETIQSFLKRLEFINVYPWIAVLEQFDEKKLVRKSTLFNLNDLSTFESIEITSNSKIFFFDIFEMENFKKYTTPEFNLAPVPDVSQEYDEKNLNLSLNSKRLINDYTISLNHNENIYNLPVYGSFKLKSLIDFLGLDMTNIDKEVSYISPLNDEIKEGNYNDLSLIAAKFNTVTFRSPVNDLINVSILGAVDYPGTYILRSNATLEDLYQYVGNFKQDAYTKGIIFTRESIREKQVQSLEDSRDKINEILLSDASKEDSAIELSAIKDLSDSINIDNLGRLTGNFSPSSKSIKKTILRDGDKIIVPLISNTISVLGAVQNQITFEFDDNISVNSAIKLAGGYSQLADKRNVYVIKSNGMTLSTKSFLIGNPSLEAGDTVVVPRKIYSQNSIVNALQPVTKVISDLAFSAAALDSLKSN